MQRTSPQKLLTLLVVVQMMARQYKPITTMVVAPRGGTLFQSGEPLAQMWVEGMQWMAHLNLLHFPICVTFSLDSFCYGLAGHGTVLL